MKWYLAGPMSHIPQFNFPEFDRVTALLRGAGHEVVSPAEMDSPEVRVAALASPTGSHDDIPKTDTWGRILARDVAIVADEVDGIVFLPKWYKSRGARLEAFVGILCDKQFAFFDYGAAGYLRLVRPEYVKGLIL